MKVHRQERLDAMKGNATLVVRESQPHFIVLNYEADAIIAEGFTTKAMAETYAKTLRTQQERWQQTRV
jgi:hypothetical protein